MFKFFFKLLAVLAIAGGLIFISLGYLVSWPATKPVTSDVLVVLGGDNGLRVRKGAQLYQEGYAPKVILTGIDHRYYKPSQPNWREKRMKELGVPSKAIMVDTRSATTWEEAVNTAETMQQEGWQKALVVSDPPHMLRLYNTWKKAFEGTSKQFILVSTSPKWWDPLFWWQTPIGYRFVISELKKNLFYSIVYY